MFPVSICVATCAMLSDIGGAAFFTPIFILIFPLLGAEYELGSTLAAVGAALFTQTFDLIVIITVILAAAMLAIANQRTGLH